MMHVHEKRCANWTRCAVISQRARGLVDDIVNAWSRASVIRPNRRLKGVDRRVHVFPVTRDSLDSPGKSRVDGLDGSDGGLQNAA